MCLIIIGLTACGTGVSSETEEQIIDLIQGVWADENASGFGFYLSVNGDLATLNRISVASSEINVISVDSTFTIEKETITLDVSTNEFLGVIKYELNGDDISLATYNNSNLFKITAEEYFLKLENVLTEYGSDIAQVYIENGKQIFGSSFDSDAVDEQMSDAELKLAELIAEEERKLAEAEAEKERLLKLGETAFSKLKSDYDQVYENTFYYHSSEPKYINTRSYVLPYLSVNKYDSVGLRIKMNYTGDSWIFYNSVVFNIDGVNKTISTSSTERDNAYGDVWEVYDVPADDSYIELLNSIVNSDKTIVRFLGSSKQYDLTISQSDKNAIADVLLAYDYYRQK